MKPGILSTTALLLTLCFAGSVTAQTGVHPLSQKSEATKTEYRRRHETELSQTVRPRKNISFSAAVEVHKKAIAALPQLFGTRAPLSTGTDAAQLQVARRSFSPVLPPLAAANLYLPEVPPSMKGYVWPSQGILTSGFGWRWGRMHQGIDIAAPVGTPIFAAGDGIVVTAEWHTGGYGNLVEIEHSDGSITLYAHNYRILVSKGEKVQAGQMIAEMGSTGFSTGPHLHFEVHLPEQGAVNPLAFLPESGLAARLP